MSPAQTGGASKAPRESHPIPVSCAGSSSWPAWIWISPACDSLPKSLALRPATEQDRRFWSFSPTTARSLRDFHSGWTRGNKLDRRVLSTFLLGQKLAARDAEKMLADALLKAKAENKRVFLIFSASWCGPCRRLARLLDTQKAELERHYVFVKLDIDRDEHAESLRDRYPESKNGGIPWFAILDAAGKELITSDMPEPRHRAGYSNIGFPDTQKGIAHFIDMLKQTAPHLSEAVIAELRKATERRR